jgi:hypothetical protein
VPSDCLATNLTNGRVVINLPIILYDGEQLSTHFKGGQVLDLKLREVNNNLSAKERLVADYIRRKAAAKDMAFRLRQSE